MFSIFSSFMAFLCRSVLLACLLPRSAARGEVLQYLTRSALSRVESRHIRVFRLFTFPAFLSKTRQYTQDFIVPSNFHHNLDIHRRPHHLHDGIAARKRTVHKTRHDLCRSHTSIMNKQKKNHLHDPPPCLTAIKESSSSSS